MSKILEDGLLAHIEKPADIKTFSPEQLEQLAAEIREALFHKLTNKGGHFGPNFGIVETTIALHYVFDSPKDKFVWDVSHLSYPHKMLTGRAEAYLDSEHFSDISGYTNQEESEHDFFKVGHTSTSVALAQGMAKARDAKGEAGNVIAVIGDGSLSGGLALEAFDFAGDMKSNLIIIVNDNEMSIAENHGGLYKNLAELRESKGAAANNLFKAMGLDYKYLDEGHNISALIDLFNEVKDIDHPIVLHIHTIKGKGYDIAVNNKETWHYVNRFDRETGKEEGSSARSWNVVTREYFLDRFKTEPSLRLITAGVPGAIGFGKAVREAAGDNFIDVGIAEEQASTMAAGMATNGINAVFATNCTFLQRAYDQISHDIAINSAPVTLIATSNSIFGATDVTHLGLYEHSALTTIPGIVSIMPTTEGDYRAALDYALGQMEKPVLILLPCKFSPELNDDFALAYKTVQVGKKVALIGLGDGLSLAKGAVAAIKEHCGFEPTVVDARIADVDEDALQKLAEEHELIVSLEATSKQGGFGQKLAGYVAENLENTKFMLRAIPTKFYDRFDLNEVLREARLTPELLAEDIAAKLN